MLSNHNGIPEYLQFTSIYKSSGFWAFVVQAGAWHGGAWQGEQAWGPCSSPIDPAAEPELLVAGKPTNNF